jgi:hypothetical protein
MKKGNKENEGASSSNVIQPRRVPDSPRFSRGPDLATARPLLVLLLVLNAVVLLGQIYPEGAPPFARTVNIVFLVLSLAYFLNALWRGVSRPW